MRPTPKTLLMGLLAAACAAVAAACYPWPEIVSQHSLVGKPLFEEYEASAVRSISIVRFHPGQNELERIELRRRGEKWIIPAHHNYVASNVDRVSVAVSALNNRIVLENQSNNQQDHATYGVVDPEDISTATNRDSLGTKITLRDRNQRELGSLIIDSQPRNETQKLSLKHFVRIPGQPSVYIIDIEADALTTSFASWTSPNLMQLNQYQKISAIEIENYRIFKEESGLTDKQWQYDIDIDIDDRTQVLQAPDPDSDQLVPISTTPQHQQQLAVIGKFLPNIRFVDVKRVTADVAKALKQMPLKNTKALQPLQEFGFLSTQTEAGIELDAVAGEVRVTSADGVVITLLIGSLDDRPASGDLALHYHLLIRADVDESILPVVEKSEPVAGESPEDSEKREKSYLRQIESRKATIKAARQRATELNRANSDWVYTVSEKIVAGIRPDVSLNEEAKEPVEPADSGQTNDAQKPNSTIE